MQQQRDSRPTIIRCKICGKKIIERLPNGVWRFVFGKNSAGLNMPPVEMLIHGSLKMRCLRRSCRTENQGHWNILNYFPNITEVTNRSEPVGETRKTNQK